MYDVANDGKILGNAIMMVCCGLGYINVFFYTLLLCNIVTLSSDANNVILAVIKPGRALAVTGILFVIVILIFATLGYILYGNENFCEAGDCDITPRNLYDTFWLVLDGGIRLGDIGSVMVRTSYQDGDSYHQRILFMLFFFIILGALLFNMVTGIIVDTFSSLRESHASREEKYKTESFISGIDREVYEEEGLDFEILKNEDQNMWSYVYYLLYLEDKHPSEHTGADRFVTSQIVAKNNNWFPISLSFELQKLQKFKQEGVSIENQVAAANQNIKVLTKQVNEMMSKLTSMEKFLKET